MKRCFAFFLFGLLMFQAIGLLGFASVAQAGSPPFCWCKGPDGKCENHGSEEAGVTWTAATFKTDKPKCDQFCKDKNKNGVTGWDSVFFDDVYNGARLTDVKCMGTGGGSYVTSKTINAPPPITLDIAISGRSTVKDLGDYIGLMYRYGVSIAVIAAIVMVTYGGFRWLLGSAIGDISKAKTIILDAIMGLILLLGAYLILNTVNPATLTLKVPALTKITGQELVLGQPNSPCVADKDCQIGGKKQICLLYDEKAGLCSDGSEGTMCVCRGLGCKRIAANWAKTNLAVDSCLEMILAAPLCWADKAGWLTTSDCTPGSQDACNNSGAGAVACQSGLTCLSDFSDGMGTWRCQKPPVTVKSPISQTPLKCYSDEFCKKQIADSASCIMIGEFGECTFGTVGQRCKCSGSGCALTDTDGRPTNNGGKRSVSCDKDLVCGLTNSRTIQSTGGMTGDWYCTKP